MSWTVIPAKAGIHGAASAGGEMSSPFRGNDGERLTLDDPRDAEGQLTDEDNFVRLTARREARAKAKHTVLTPLVIRAIREACGLSQREASQVFGGGPKAFEKYESGEVAPGGSMTRLLVLAARQPDRFAKGTGLPIVSEADAALIRETVRRSSVERTYERIYNSGGGGGGGMRDTNFPSLTQLIADALDQDARNAPTCRAKRMSGKWT
jgi:putative zinc finger/helix-turn-helix YgiT family protein